MSIRSTLTSRVAYVSFVAAAAIASLPYLAFADGPPAPPTPPEEAYSACDSKSAGDTCTVTIHDHTMEGTCNQRESDTRLSCRPNHRRGPPPQQ